MKKFTTTEIRNLFNQVMREDISFSEMVEIMNERASERVEDVPVRKFQDGDKVVLKSGCENIQSGFSYYCSMDEWIGKPITVSGINSDDDIYGFDDCPWNFAEDWLEPYEGLKEGDLAIFWDNVSRLYASVRIFGRLTVRGYCDITGVRWDNAIKFESKEQYERLINGEI